MRLASVAAVSDTGRKRARNEDAYVLAPPLFAVADGMGGAQAGEHASRLATTAIGERSGDETVAELFEAANRRIFESALADAALHGMGTTLTLALVHDDRVTIGHVGDSRAYRLRDGAIEQLTADHSLVAELVRSGRLTPEQAGSHPQRSVITRALGTEAQVLVDVFDVELRGDDVFLLCSDGLTTMVSDSAIRDVLAGRRSDLQSALRELVAAANRAGGEDNITVVAFELVEDELDSTMRMSALDAEPEGAGAEQEREPEEDTLTGLEPMPAVAAVEPEAPAREDEWLEPAAEEPEPQQAFPAAKEVRRRRRRRRRAIALLTVALVAVAAAAGVIGLSRAHFIGAEPDGHVAVYQGLPWSLGGGVRLYRTVFVSRLLASQLTAGERRSLFDHTLRSRSRAITTVERLDREVNP